MKKLSEPTILVIDDDQKRLETILETLGELGHQGSSIKCAKTEKDAMQLIKGVNANLAVVDANLTCKCELEGLYVIRKIMEENKGCIVICITSQGDKETGPSAIRAGAKDYIDCEWSYINWIEYLKQRIDLWLGVLKAQQQN